jgi:hypothetical protein
MPFGRLGEDQRAPFRFRKGDRVAWLTARNAPSTEFRGEIVDGWCSYDDPVGILDETYQVRIDGNRFFTASGNRLTTA